CKKCGGPLSDDEVTIQATAETSGSLELTCPNCGKPHRASAGFCKGCGKPLVDRKVSDTGRSTGQLGDTRTVPPTVAAGAPPTTQSPTATSSPSTDQTVKCDKCGTLNQSGMSFCKSCRARIGAHAKKVRMKKVVAAVVIGAALFVVLIALVGWYFWGAKVTIKTEPSEAKVAIDGKEVGTSNTFGILTVSHIRAGEHILSVKHDRYDDLEQPFKTGLTDFSKNLNAKLNLTKYKLTVVVSPPESTILVDNGVTIAGRDASGNPIVESLAPGDHSVVVSHDGYRDWKQNVTVNGDTKIQVTLSSAPAYDPTSSDADSEIRSTLEGWAQSTRNRDVDSHMRYYSDTLDY